MVYFDLVANDIMWNKRCFEMVLSRGHLDFPDVVVVHGPSLHAATPVNTFTMNTRSSECIKISLHRLFNQELPVHAPHF